MFKQQFADSFIIMRDNMPMMVSVFFSLSFRGQKLKKKKKGRIALYCFNETNPPNSCSFPIVLHTHVGSLDQSLQMDLK